VSQRKIKEFWIDPQSGQYSASRALLTVLIADMQVLIVCDLCGLKFSAWAQFAIIVSAVAGIYWFNSTARVWKETYSAMGTIKPPIKVPKRDEEE
jgi:uncharacterized membrane protein YuzA (DUF378 family)